MKWQLLFLSLFVLLRMTRVNSQELMFTPERIRVFQMMQGAMVTFRSTGSLQEIEELAPTVLADPKIALLISKFGIADVQNNEGTSLLLAGAAARSLLIVKTALAIGADIDLRDENGWSALQWVVSKNDTELSVHLIAEGADVHAQNNVQGDAALHWASYLGNVKVTRNLIHAGADVNVRNFLGDTPITVSAPQGHLVIIDLLIQNGADVDSQNNEGWTALIMATDKNHTAVVRSLLRARANPDLQSSHQGETALIYAVSRGFTDIALELVMSGADLDLANRKGLTPLASAARANRESEVQLLLLAGANVDSQAVDGDTALMEAVNLGFTDAARAILEFCPDLSLTNNYGLRADKIAIEKNEEEIHNMILEHYRLVCNVSGILYKVGNTRFNSCWEMQCCQGIWSPTGRSLQSCGLRCRTHSTPILGVCTAIDNCSHLQREAEAILNTLPIDTQAGYDFIESHGCGMVKGNIKVCCLPVDSISSIISIN